MYNSEGIKVEEGGIMMDDLDLIGTEMSDLDLIGTRVVDLDLDGTADKIQV